MWVTRTASSGSKPIEEVKKDVKAEPQTPPIVGSGSPVQKNQEIPRIKRNDQKNKRVDKAFNGKKSTLEILMEDD